MIINGDALVRPIIRELLNVIDHNVILELKTGLVQDLSASLVIKNASDTALTGSLPMGIGKVQRFSTDLGSGTKDYILVRLTCNITQYLIPLVVGSLHKAAVTLTYKEDGTQIWTREEAIYFSPENNIADFDVSADESEALTAAELNKKFTHVYRPGVIYGMKITHGTGTWMFNVDAGACITPLGHRIEITSNCLNAFRIQPHTGPATHRIDAVAISHTLGHEPVLEVVQGTYGGPMPDVQDTSKTVIGFIRLDSTTDAPAKAGIAPNISRDFRRFERLRRVFNEDLSDQADGANDTFELNEPLQEGSEDFRVNGVRKTNLYYSTIRFRSNNEGLGGAIIIKAGQTPPGASDVVTIDYDVPDRRSIDPTEIASYWTDAPPEFPWSDASIVLEKPQINTNLDSGHVVSWFNTGTASTAAGMTVNRFNVLSPYAVLDGGGVKFPRDGGANTNYTHGVVTYSSLVPQPSTLIFMAKYDLDYPSGAILTSDSLEPGPLPNFGVSVKHLAGYDPEISMSLAGVLHESPSGAGLLNKQVYVMQLKASGDIHLRVNNHDYGTIAGTSVAGFPNLDEFYMINDLTTTFYWFAYWERELVSDEIDSIVEGLLSGHIV